MDSEDIKRAAAYAGVPIAEVARKIGQRPQNLQNKLARGSLKPADLAAIAAAIGGDYHSYIEFPDGVRIGRTGSHSGQTLEKEEA